MGSQCDDCGIFCRDRRGGCAETDIGNLVLVGGFSLARLVPTPWSSPSRPHSVPQSGKREQVSSGWNRTELTTLTGARTWCGHGVFAHNLVKISALAS